MPSTLRKLMTWYFCARNFNTGHSLKVTNNHKFALKTVISNKFGYPIDKRTVWDIYFNRRGSVLRLGNRVTLRALLLLRVLNCLNNTIRWHIYLRRLQTPCTLWIDALASAVKLDSGQWFELDIYLHRSTVWTVSNLCGRQFILRPETDLTLRRNVYVLHYPYNSLNVA